MLDRVPMLIVMCLLSPLGAALGSDSVDQFRNRGTEYQLYSVPIGYVIEYPKSGWTVHLGPSGSVLFAQNKSEAAVVVEIMQLKEALVSDDLNDTFVRFETDRIKTSHPQSGAVAAVRREIAGNQGMVFSYMREGPRGPEHVRQYSIPIGLRLYRVICSASPTNFKAKYDPVFERMAGSVKGGAAQVSPSK